MVDVLVQSMLWHGRCFGAVNISAQSIFRHGQCFAVVDVSVQSMLRCGRCYGMIDVSAQSMFRRGKCFARNIRNKHLGYKINYWLMKYIITCNFFIFERNLTYDSSKSSSRWSLSCWSNKIYIRIQMTHMHACNLAICYAFYTNCCIVFFNLDFRDTE